MSNSDLQRRLLSPRSVRLSVACVAAFLGSLICCGCGSPPEDTLATFPASGTVMDAAGKPLSGGFVEFQSNTDQNLLAVGDIQADGSFVLITYVNGVATEGAVVGEHQVTVHPPQIEHGGAEPIRMRRPRKIEATENILALQVPRR